MDERELLLLGMLKAQSQHGYQINEFIERTLGRVTDMKKPTAYAILERLCQKGYVTVHSEQEGNRPPRKVYSISPAGEALFFQLLRANLAAVDRISAAGEIGLMFLDSLSRDEVIALLQQRRAKLEEQIASYERAPRHQYTFGVNLAVERQLNLLRADHDWLDSVLARLQDTSVSLESL